MGAVYSQCCDHQSSSASGAVEDSSGNVATKTASWKENKGLRQRAGDPEKLVIFKETGIGKQEVEGEPVKEEAEDDEEDLDSPARDDVIYGANDFFSRGYSVADASKAGFYSWDNPPEVGSHVACFQKQHYLQQGTVREVTFKVSDGTAGLLAGVRGAWVTITEDSGEEFQTWAGFLAPVNDHEYSSICTEEEYLKSSYYELNVELAMSSSSSQGLSGLKTAKADARASMQAWLCHLVDADGRKIDITPELQAELTKVFDEHEDPSIHLYSTQSRLGARTSASTGRDYTLYYRALNNTLNHDLEVGLKPALPLLRRMTYLLLFAETTGEKRIQQANRVWKGDTERPVPLNMQKLRDAQASGSCVRFRQFQSTTSDEKLARKYRRREDTPGYLWTIDIPEGFWGARNIQDVSWRKHEAETLFPPYARFKVLEVAENGCHLQAVSRQQAIEVADVTAKA